MDDKTQKPGADGACPCKNAWTDPRCRTPMNCGRWGCLRELNRGRRKALSREPLPVSPSSDSIRDAYVAMLEAEVSWIPSLLEFMDVKLAHDEDYEILRSLLDTIALGRIVKRPREPGHVFKLVHFNRWAERLGEAECLEAARNGTLATTGPRTNPDSD